VSTVLDNLQKTIDSLHGEKSRLIEEVDYLSQLLNFKEKSYGASKMNPNYYSFREDKRDLRSQESD
jgi:hypothetical protein